MDDNLPLTALTSKEFDLSRDVVFSRSLDRGPITAELGASVLFNMPPKQSRGFHNVFLIAILPTSETIEGEWV
jgi:hypothetical protein